MNSSIAPCRDQITLTIAQRSPGYIDGMAGVRGADYPEGEPRISQRALNRRKVLFYLSLPGPWVGDDDRRAERTVHCRRRALLKAAALLG